MPTFASNPNLKEEFLKKSFGDVRKHQQELFAIQDAPPEVPDFGDSSSEHAESEEHEPEFQESSSETMFDASDAEPVSQRRQYTPRRVEPMVFLGKQVCVRAGARLLGVGQTSLQKLRSGEQVFVQKSGKGRVPASAKHPTLGFSMRGLSNEQCPIHV